MFSFDDFMLADQGQWLPVWHSVIQMVGYSIDTRL